MDKDKVEMPFKGLIGQTMTPYEFDELDVSVQKLVETTWSAVVKIQIEGIAGRFGTGWLSTKGETHLIYTSAHLLLNDNGQLVPENRVKVFLDDEVCDARIKFAGFPLHGFGLGPPAHDYAILEIRPQKQRSSK